MHTTTHIAPHELDNTDDPAFADPFFARQRQRPATYRLTDEIEREYLFPTFYGDVTTAAAVFGADLTAARSLVRDRLGPGVRPVCLDRRRAAVAVAAYDYRSVRQIPPYHEMAVVIPVQVGGRWHPPLLPLLLQRRFGSFGHLVVDMPVTSRENQLRGNRIWNLPKTTRRVDIAQDADALVATAFGEDGAPYLQLRVPTRTGTTAHSESSVWIYSRLDGALVRSRSRLSGDLAKHTSLRPPRAGRQTASAAIGDGAEAATLRTLGIDGPPLHWYHGSGLSSSFDLPTSSPSRS
ncbi:hypothetical protein BHE97_07820 [Aeromicrobium sp. PE09-221]|uniref:hypothetical protein n=1 Tax=Actinomycetes TaxID=1760 RepID=UPI000B3E4CA0|nr:MULTISPECIES: hypothetical protein [Actinomycetes]MCT2138640.1 hypothetical protein [Dietzia cinnamea]OUZ10255.1 hypothetical protein BHE97_07820 [Aeromicrobium sp. PE09-221]